MQLQNMSSKNNKIPNKVDAQREDLPIPDTAEYAYTACHICNKSFKRHELWYKHFEKTGHLNFSLVFDTEKEKKKEKRLLVS